MLRAQQICLLILCTFRTVITTSDERQPLMNCSLSTPTDCPAHSLCSIVAAQSKCVCVSGYERNPDWELMANLTPNDIFPYCRSENDSSADVVPPNKESKLLVYIRSPARADHLVFSILLVLLAAVLAVALIYVTKVLKPLKRTRVAYVKLKRRNRTHQRLEEEFDGIAMERRGEGTTTQYF